MAADRILGRGDRDTLTTASAEGEGGGLAPPPARKLDPWNSVRVSLSVPREAASRLRHLAAASASSASSPSPLDGAAAEGLRRLRALGILSVQLDGDQLIQLQEPSHGGGGGVLPPTNGPSLQQLLGAAVAATTATTVVSAAMVQTAAAAPAVAMSSDKVQFRSPNVVCPADSIVPKVPVPSASTNATPAPPTKAYAGPFPFTSMNQAMHTTSRDVAAAASSSNGPPPLPPPPYPGKHPPVTLSSPLLVNLLQNEQCDTNIRVTQTPAVATLPLPESIDSSNNVPTQRMPSAFVPAKQTIRTTPQYPHKTPSLPPPAPPVTCNSVPPPQPQPTHSIAAIQNKVLFAHHNNNVLAPHLHHHHHLHQSTPQHQQQQQHRQHLHHHLPQNKEIPSAAPLAPPSQPSRNPVPYSAAPPPVQYAPPQTQPPPYPIGSVTARHWEQQQQHQQQQQQQQQTVQPMPQLQELTPSLTLTDLKADLDHLLPSLERDLAGSPPDLPDDLLNDKDLCLSLPSVLNTNLVPPSNETLYLINPLTGEMEPQSAGSDSEEEPFRDVFTGLPSPANFSDEDTNSTIRPDTTDQSDSESRSCHSDSSKHSKLKGGRGGGGGNRSDGGGKGRDSPNFVGKPVEKIKLRLKLEKSEPVSPAYKVDVSFINTQPPKKAVPVAAPPAAVPPTGEELRVPPLHISLRGRNSMVISNKKKCKLNPDGTPMVKAKPKKMQAKKDGSIVSDLLVNDGEMSDYGESRKLKKPKLSQEVGISLSDLETPPPIYNHHMNYKDKLKERRGSDSELARTTKKYAESNGVLSEDKKRRLSQSEDQPAAVLGSTNMGTVASLFAHKRKEKIKLLKENFKNKELNRFKSFTKSITDKVISKQVTLPTGEIDMEAKFKQRLMEDADTNVHHRTESPVVKEVIVPVVDTKVEDLIQTLEDTPPLKDKPPEPDKCNTPDRKGGGGEMQDKQQPNRSPPNSGGAQGEDSGIESMDALSEKSPNQASQSPHAELPDPPKSKTQVPDMLDIEAQLAKMEGMDEDLNENHEHHVSNHDDSQPKLDEQCCGLTAALLSPRPVTPPPAKEPSPPPPEADDLPKGPPTEEVERSKAVEEDEDLEPLPVRVTPPLYTYSNPDKRSTPSPALSETDASAFIGKKSLLEQLLIEIPENAMPSSPSPATRSVRTRASSKMNSPELLSSPVINNKTRSGTAPPAPATKRKRNESDSSNHSVDDLQRVTKKSRKNLDTVVEMATESPHPKKKVLEESSDSDEPLIELAGKVRNKGTNNSGVGGAITANNKVKLKHHQQQQQQYSAVTAPGVTTGTPSVTGSGTTTATTATTAVTTATPTASVNTRRSIRTMPAAVNTRSKGDKSNPEGDVVRRKTRSAVSEGEGKRRKDVK